MKTYSTPSAPKRFVFIRNSDIGWVTGKFLETISGEYESTIAKGALYTRLFIFVYPFRETVQSYRHFPDFEGYL